MQTMNQCLDRLYKAGDHLGGRGAGATRAIVTELKQMMRRQ
jgi:hypothetical protein